MMRPGLASNLGNGMPSILVVEDDFPVYETISVAFSLRPGFAVSHAADGRCALACLEAALPDLALIDIGLPKASGFDVATRAVELGVPAVLMTAYGDAADRAGHYGFPVLPKPFHVIELAARFDDVVSEAARLNRAMSEHIKTAQALVARAGTLRQSPPD